MSHWQRRIRKAYFLQCALFCAAGLAGWALLRLDGRADLAGTRAAMFAGMACALLAAAWVGNCITRSGIAPVCWLLRAIGQWDPRQPGPDAFAPERLPPDLPEDVRRVAEALHGFGVRAGAHAAREREFTRAASHELRTPLTIIRVAADLIGHDAALADNARRSLERIQCASAGMEAIIDSLLLLARSEEVAPESEDFPLTEVVERELERVKPAADRKQLQLRMVKHATPTLHAPPRLLQVVLGHLLDNAIRFTQAGEVAVHLLEDRLQVEDTGPGMDEDVLAHAIEPFYCGSGPCDASGPGLGLTIAHRIAERCGWSLALDSDPGRGTRASVHFGRDSLGSA